MGMGRLQTVIALFAVASVVIVTLGATAASGGDSEGERYRAYSLLRERLKTCSLDRGWRHLGTTARRRCAKLRRQYVLYAVSGESSEFFVFCKRAARRCPPAPIGARDPRAPIPQGSTIFR